MPRKARGAHVVAGERQAVLKAGDAAPGGVEMFGGLGLARRPIRDDERRRDEDQKPDDGRRYWAGRARLAPGFRPPAPRAAASIPRRSAVGPPRVDPDQHPRGRDDHAARRAGCRGSARGASSRASSGLLKATSRMNPKYSDHHGDRESDGNSPARGAERRKRRSEWCHGRRRTVWPARPRHASVSPEVIRVAGARRRRRCRVASRRSRTPLRARAASSSVSPRAKPRGDRRRKRASGAVRVRPSMRGAVSSIVAGTRRPADR